jgi:hypothetical protein
VHIAIHPDWGVFAKNNGRPEKENRHSLAAMTLNCDDVSYYLGDHPALTPEAGGRLLLDNVPDHCTKAAKVHLSFRVDSPPNDSVFDEPLSIINPIFRVRDSDGDGIIDVEEE